MPASALPIIIAFCAAFASFISVLGFVSAWAHAKDKKHS